MKHVNLIPPDRRRRISDERRAAAWLRFTVIYTALLATGLLIVQITAVPESVDTGSRLLNARAEADAIRTESTAMREQISALTTELRRAKRVRQQPDWSGLFALASAHLGDQILLTRFALETPQGDSNVLNIRGTAREQQAVTAYLLAMERSGVFATVRLVEQRRTGAADTGKVDFAIECIIDDGGAS